MRNTLLLFIAIAVSVCTEAGAEVIRDSVFLQFRQSHVDLDSTYMTNPEELDHARRSIYLHHRPDSSFVLQNVTVVGGASPEGSVSINERLSRGRAERIFDYVRTFVDMPDSLTTFTFLGRDWNGLRRMVSADMGVPYRDDVLAALDGIIAEGDEREEGTAHIEKIKSLHGGVPYRYMYSRLFPTLRASQLVLTFDSIRPAVSIPAMPLTLTETVGVITDMDIRIIEFPEQTAKKPFYMALKTNMLYDALAVPNISAEFYLGKNISAVANWMYGWWDKDRTHRYWRVYGGDIALRWWFGKKAHEKPLTGHHLGVYGGVVTYDFEFGGKGYMGGLPGHWLWDRFNRQFGVEYGYSLPIGRRLNIDFNIGIGYLGGEYREYVPKDRCYVWQATKHLNWIGPTKLEISLAWLIGRGNFNTRKGGGL